MNKSLPSPDVPTGNTDAELFSNAIRKVLTGVIE